MVAITQFALSAIAIATLAGAVPTSTYNYNNAEAEAAASAMAAGHFGEASAAAEAAAKASGGKAMAEASAEASASSSSHGHGHRNVHKITAGFDGKLIFNPERIVADKGDLIEVHYLPKNHSVTQSSFAKPCVPLNGQGIFSGFNFATMQGEAKDVFVFEVEDTQPEWFYCSQTVGSHCQMGMAFVINENAKSGNTLDKYKEAASETKVSVSPPIEPFGGFIVPNGKHY